MAFLSFYGIMCRVSELLEHLGVKFGWSMLKGWSSRAVTTKYCKWSGLITVLEARSQRSRCQQGHAPSEGSREGSVPGPSPKLWLFPGF